MPVTRARRRMPAAAALVALVVVAGACHSGGTTFKAGENDVNPMPVDKLQDGGTLNWPIGALPVNYNFNQSGANTPDELAIVSAVMPTLFTFDASGSPSVNAAYLTSAAVTGQSPQVVTYEINPKAAWDDGTPITEADFAAQWQALNGSNRTFRAAAPAGYAGIGGVAQGKGPKEVVVTFKQPYAAWRSLFSPLFPASLNAEPSIFNGGWVTGTATSAGPFLFQGADTVAKTVTLVRDPKWWGGAPKLYSIVYHAVGSDPSAQLDALGKGQVDFVGLAPDHSQLARAKAMSGVVVRRAAGPAFRQLTFNGTSAALGDATLRRAVALAIDRAAVAKAVLDPLGVLPKTLDNHIYMGNQAGYQANAGDLASANATQAAALLDQDGWKSSGSPAGGVRTRNGQPLSIRLVIPDNSAEAPQESALLKSQLQAVGITLVVQSVPAQQFFDSFVIGGDFDLALFSWQGTLFPISAALPIYASPTVTSNGVDVHQNYARIGSAAIDQLFAEATAELDPAKAIQLGNQIDVAIWKEVHSLTLYQLPQLFAERRTLANFGAFGFASLNYQTIGFTGS